MSAACGWALMAICLAWGVVGLVLVAVEFWLEWERRRALREWMARVRETEMFRRMTEAELIPTEWPELYRADIRKDQP